MLVSPWPPSKGGVCPHLAHRFVPTSTAAGPNPDPARSGPGPPARPAAVHAVAKTRCEFPRGGTNNAHGGHSQRTGGGGQGRVVGGHGEGCASRLAPDLRGGEVNRVQRSEGGRQRLRGPSPVRFARSPSPREWTELVDGFAAFGQCLVGNSLDNPQAVESSQTFHFGQRAGDSFFHGSPFSQGPRLSSTSRRQRNRRRRSLRCRSSSRRATGHGAT